MISRQIRQKTREHVHRVEEKNVYLAKFSHSPPMPILVRMPPDSNL